jgi:hypothetical protein
MRRPEQLASGSKSLLALVPDGIGKVVIKGDRQIADLGVHAKVDAFGRLPPPRRKMESLVELGQIACFDGNVEFAEIPGPEAQFAPRKTAALGGTLLPQVSKIGHPRAFTISSVIFLASPKSIMVLSRKKSSFSIPA